MHVMVTVDLEETARDRRRILLLRQVDDVVVCGRGGRYRLRPRLLDGRHRRLRIRAQAAMNADLPSIDAAFAPGDAAITPGESAERRRDIGEAGIAWQQDADLDLAANSQRDDADALAARSGRAQRLPNVEGIARHQACHRDRRVFGKRGLAYEGAHEFAAAWLEQDLKLGGARDGGFCHGRYQRRFIVDRRVCLDRRAQLGKKVLRVMGSATPRAHSDWIEFRCALDTLFASKALIGRRRFGHTYHSATIW